MKLRIMNDTGHTELEVSASEMIEQINDHPTHWVFVDGDMVSREAISSVDWEQVDNVNLIPAMVGGVLQISTSPFHSACLQATLVIWPKHYMSADIPPKSQQRDRSCQSGGKPEHCLMEREEWNYNKKYYQK